MTTKKGDNQTFVSGMLALMGRNFKRLRIDMGLDQREVARLAGVATTTVQKIEYGQSVQLSNLIAVCHALNITPAQLFIEKIPYATFDEAIDKAVAERVDQRVREALAKYGHRQKIS